MFNSSLFYELAVLKDCVWPLLREVPDTEPEFGEARRLLKFLDHFTSLDGKEIPPTSHSARVHRRQQLRILERSVGS